MRADADMHAWIVARYAFDSFQREGIIRIYADEDIEIAVLQGGQIVPQHRLDHGVLVPQRHEDGDTPLLSLRQLRFRWPRKRFASPREENEIDEQVVQAAD